MRDRRHYTTLSRLFAYPQEEYKKDVNACMEMLQMQYPKAAESLKRFVDYVQENSIDDIEENYTKTFHIQAICYLDLGYVLFGEEYKRGAFLVEMKREQQLVNNDCGTDLPDNLENVLTLMSKTANEEFLNELVVMALIPALQKMIREFTAERMDLRNRVLRKKHSALLLEDIQHGNIYKNALATLLLVLEEDFKDVDVKLPDELPAASPAFLTKCGTCSTTEDNVEKTKLK